MGVTIPCGNKPSIYGNRCREETLCPNCTALRGLMAACLNEADRLEQFASLTRSHGGKNAAKELMNSAGRLRAALAAARPAGSHTEETT